jgi:hypothetical protein
MRPPPRGAPHWSAAGRRSTPIAVRTCGRKAEMPANCGLFGRDQERPVGIELRGGPGRTRTSNQTVMSAVTLSEASIESGVFRDANQRMFTIGCGQSLAKRWLARHA